MKTWFNVPENSDFSIYNLPFGIFSTAGHHRRAGVAIGDHIIDLEAVAQAGAFHSLAIDNSVFSDDTLNRYIALGKATTITIRCLLQEWLCTEGSVLQKNKQVFVAQADATMHMPVAVGDYTDFYASIDHATNVGKMFRGPENALMPNWKHLPVGYHGRASSIVLSGTNLKRPKGQVKPADATAPVFQASARVDFELEMAFVIGKENGLGNSVSTEEANEYIFGFVMFNDWSARDIQAWEYVPLGPFLAKNFGSNISPWIVTTEALAPFRVAGPKQEPAVLPYLQIEGDQNFDVNLNVYIKPENGEENLVSESNFKYMYWSANQMVAHHTVNGCNLRVGDMMASGTISGPQKHQFGSMLELTWGGKEPLTLANGEQRKFIDDNDTVIMRGFAEKDGKRVGFGEVSCKILPAD
ncbi:fumarylacetoacetase [bacterium]|nr:fumarylacetoacetase [bacterium]